MNLIVLLPKFILSGPIKGALAICKLYSLENHVTVIFLRGDINFNSKEYNGVKFITLKESKNYFMKILQLRKEIKQIKFTNLTMV